MKKWLIRTVMLALLLAIVAVGSWKWVVAYTHSCGYIYDQRLSDLTANESDRDRNWAQWIRQNYGYLTWGITHKPYDNQRLVYWETPFKKYEVISNVEWKYAMVEFKSERFQPTLDEIFRCVGAPEYYAAIDMGGADVISYYASLWYPQSGFSAEHESYSWQRNTPIDELHRVKATDQYSCFHYVRPNDLTTVVYQSSNNQFGNEHELLKLVKPWQGLEKAVFELPY